MPFDAMILPSDSMNPPTPNVPDMPLYILVENGQFVILDVQDTPCYTLTPEGSEELHNG